MAFDLIEWRRIRHRRRLMRPGRPSFGEHGGGQGCGIGTPLAELDEPMLRGAVGLHQPHVEIERAFGDRRAIIHRHRQRVALDLTVNYCAPIAEGPFDLDVRLVKANRSSQHWSVEMTQGGGEVTTLATAVFAERRPS